jgi:hypothetical protein
VYKTPVKKYTVTFYQENGETVISTAQYEYNTAAADVVKPEAPAKASTDEYIYSFG